MLVAPGFVSVAPCSLLCPSCAGRELQADSWCAAERREADSIEHLLGQKAEDMLLQRTVIDCQMWGMLSRCWENVSLPQVGKALTSIMAESLFLSYLLLPKQSASSKLSLNSDKNGMITKCSNNLCVNQSTSHYVMQWHIHYEPFTVCYPQLAGSCSARVPWLLITC